MSNSGLSDFNRFEHAAFAVPDQFAFIQHEPQVEPNPELGQDHLEYAIAVQGIATELSLKGEPAHAIHIQGRFTHGTMKIKQTFFGDLSHKDLYARYTTFTFDQPDANGVSKEHSVYVTSDGNIESKGDHEDIDKFYAFIAMANTLELSNSPAEAEIADGLISTFMPSKTTKKIPAPANDNLDDRLQAFIDEAHFRHIYKGTAYEVTNALGDSLKIEFYPTIDIVKLSHQETNLQPTLIVRYTELEEIDDQLIPSTYGLRVNEEGHISPGATDEDPDMTEDTLALLLAIRQIAEIERSEEDPELSAFCSSEQVHETIVGLLEDISLLGSEKIAERTAVIELGATEDGGTCIVVTERKHADTSLDYEVLWTVDDLPVVGASIDASGNIDFLPILHVLEDEDEEIDSFNLVDAIGLLQQTLLSAKTDNVTQNDILPNILEVLLNENPNYLFEMSELRTILNDQPALLRTRKFVNEPGGYKPLTHFSFYEPANELGSYGHFLTIVQDPNIELEGTTYAVIEEDEGPLYYDNSLTYRESVAQHPWEHTARSRQLDAVHAALQKLHQEAISTQANTLGDEADAFLKNRAEGGKEGGS